MERGNYSLSSFAVARAESWGAHGRNNLVDKSLTDRIVVVAPVELSLGVIASARQHTAFGDQKGRNHCWRGCEKTDQFPGQIFVGRRCTNAQIMNIGAG